MSFVKAKGLALIAISALFLIFFSSFSTSAENGFSQQDRELLIELRVRVGEIAVVTPLIGMSAFVIHGVAKDVPLYTIFHGTVPFLAAMIVCLIIVIAFPQVALFLPSTMMGLR